MNIGDRVMASRDVEFEELAGFFGFIEDHDFAAGYLVRFDNGRALWLSGDELSLTA
jgi:hypothetical protein